MNNLAQKPATSLVRSEGLTASERALKAMCDRSFLSLWSYPNLFIDKGNAQELCDVLIVFGEQLIIFSDKSCEFPDTGDLALDWARWYRRSIRKSADQVFGAERWLRSHPTRIFLDAKHTQRFPLQIPPPERLKVHRIVVALGAAKRCRSHLGGSGSLMLSPLAPGGSLPFTVTDIEPHKGFVHVLDDVTLSLLLDELDTVGDFVAYLAAKERLVRGRRLVSAAGEEELLGYYLRGIGVGNEHDFKIPEDATAIVLDEGFWAATRQDPRYLGREEANQVSYLWDSLIEAFAGHAAAGTLAVGQEHGVQEHEKALRIMAAERRVARRMLATAILQKVEGTAVDKQSTRLVLGQERRDVGYVFMLEPRPEGMVYEKYRERRTEKLNAYCRVARYLHPQLVHVVGIATEPRGSDGSSEDLAYLDATGWNEEDDRLAGELHSLGLFREMRQTKLNGQEFPGPSQRERNKRKRERRRRARGG